ncbi:serine hydrolase domain-containing protein [Pedobacter ginsengisoli]|uniref:serine hydrolase domain-containing protein n=1 Tax=Pedobacter ginsengisoli TaxID=363852 RepID=UPI00254BA4D6|nr:serine hydrolase domain-containing protein [Pedobacter ginsengisoli]
MKKTLFLMLMLLIGYCSFAQEGSTLQKNIISQRSDNPMKSKLDSTIDKLILNYMKEGKRVGISLGINYNGKQFIYNYGETSPGSGILPSDKSVYEIGSITKTFTGLLVAHAINEGRVSLNDDIRKFLPGSFPNLQYPNGDPVKIAYLLAHTAQFPNSFGDPLSPSVGNETFIDSLHKIKLDSLKSFRYKYSNVGYQLLGLILERVYKKSYIDLISQYVTKPLGMLQTKLDYPANEESSLLKGYGTNREPVRSIPEILPAAGGLHSSVRDMLKYLDYQIQEKTAEVRLTHRVIFGDVDKEAYGFQWAIGKNWGWDQYLRIDGGTQGYRTFCVMYPLHNVSIVLFSNQKDDSAGAGLYKVATGIYGALKLAMNAKSAF